MLSCDFQASGPFQTYSNLLEELVLALVGVTGDVFVDTNEQLTEGQKFRNYGYINPDKPSFRLDVTVATWVAAPERYQLEELLRLGFHYRELDKFVESCHLGANVPAYRRALGAGVSELQDVYQAAIIQVQQHLRTESTPVVPAVKNFLIDFQTLLPQVHRLVHKVDKDKLMGADLLKHLHNSAQTGLPTLQSCVRRLLWHCHQVLYKQLSGWMVHGHLANDDFFIARVPVVDSENGTSEDSSWAEDYSIEIQRLPPYISVPTAEHVKFIGKAVQMLRRPKGEFEGQDLLPYKNTLEYADSLRQLQEQPVFQRVAFERTVESIRSKVAQHLWQLVVVKAELRNHLRALRNYFLLASGEFFHNFLDEAKHLMELPVREAAVHTDITAAFDQSASKSTVQHDKFFSLVTIKWIKGPLQIYTGKNKPVHIPVYDPNWDNLHLEYKVRWPLFSIITKNMVEKYNAMFMLLLRLKRVRLGLEEAWLLISSHQKDWGNRNHIASGSRAQLWQLHQHLFHFITNLEIYLQMDVIEANFSKLLEEIDGTQDFMRASKQHEKYLFALLSHSFMQTKILPYYLTQVFSCSREVCVIIKEDDGSSKVDAERSMQIDKLVRSFTDSIRSVYVLLQSNRLQEWSGTTSLRQLFLRLNFNGFIDRNICKEGGNAGGSDAAQSKDVEMEEPQTDNWIPRRKPTDDQLPTPRRAHARGNKKPRTRWEDRTD